jgi:hypothetical protein
MQILHEIINSLPDSTVIVITDIYISFQIRAEGFLTNGKSRPIPAITERQYCRILHRRLITNWRRKASVRVM